MTPVAGQKDPLRKEGVYSYLSVSTFVRRSPWLPLARRRRSRRWTEDPTETSNSMRHAPRPWRRREKSRAGRGAHGWLGAGSRRLQNNSRPPTVACHLRRWLRLQTWPLVSSATLRYVSAQLLGRRRPALRRTIHQFGPLDRSRGGQWSSPSP